VTQGATHLALLGRSAPSTAAAQAVEQLRARGAQVLILQADVSDVDQLAAALNQLRQAAPPLVGAIHAAGILDDGLLLHLTPERLQRVLAPKVAGAWNLHTLTQTDPLECFVLFSSAAGLLGSPGQANYAAANAFLDALAHYRRAHGRPAMSIDWGPWSEVGLAAAQANRGQRLATRGVPSLTPAQGLALLGLLLDAPPPQVAVMPFNVRQWRQFYPKVASSPLFALLPEAANEPAAPGASPVRAALRQAAPADRRRLLEAHLIDQMAQVLRIERGQIDPQRPLSAIGFESLLALEYRNRLEASLGLTLPATLVWGHPTIASLAPHLAERMGLSFDGQPVSAPVVEPTPVEPGPAQPRGADLPAQQTFAELEQLSEAEALQALLAGGQPTGGLA
jgi:acyl carrier protein